MSGESTQDLIDSHILARAFSEFPTSHGDHYPPFQTADDVLTQLRPFLANEAAKINDYGHTSTTLSRLEATGKKATWNKSLSGAKASETEDSKWIFYFQAIHSQDRFVVGYSDGKVSNHHKSELQDILKNPVKN